MSMQHASHSDLQFLLSFSLLGRLLHFVHVQNEHIQRWKDWFHHVDKLIHLGGCEGTSAQGFAQQNDAVLFEKKKTETVVSLPHDSENKQRCNLGLLTTRQYGRGTYNSFTESYKCVVIKGRNTTMVSFKRDRNVFSETRIFLRACTVIRLITTEEMQVGITYQFPGCFSVSHCSSLSLSLSLSLSQPPAWYWSHQFIRPRVTGTKNLCLQAFFSTKTV
jgi:hypothetical protein